MKVCKVSLALQHCNFALSAEEPTRGRLSGVVYEWKFCLSVQSFLCRCVDVCGEEFTDPLCHFSASEPYETACTVVSLVHVLCCTVNM